MVADLVMSGQPARGRSCGHCRACCVALPVLELGKGANESCRYLCTKGCSIYTAKPFSCSLWSCRWLIDPGTASLPRPDRAGYIIDSVLAPFLANGNECQALQVWIDPEKRHLHEDPVLRAYLAKMAETYGLPAIIRFSDNEGFMLFAPCLMAEHEWTILESQGGMKTPEELRQIARAQPSPMIEAESR